MFAGNDLNGISIQQTGIVDRAKAQNYPFAQENNTYALVSPDGYKFSVIDAASTNDPVTKVTLNTNDLAKTKSYWTDALKIQLKNENPKEITLAYSDNQAQLAFKHTGKD